MAQLQQSRSSESHFLKDSLQEHFGKDLPKSFPKKNTLGDWGHTLGCLGVGGGSCILLLVLKYPQLGHKIKLLLWGLLFTLFTSWAGQKFN